MDVLSSNMALLIYSHCSLLVLKQHVFQHENMIPPGKPSEISTPQCLHKQIKQILDCVHTEGQPDTLQF